MEMEIELLAEIRIDGGGRYSNNYEGSPARINREVALKALNQLYGYKDGIIPMSDDLWSSTRPLPSQPGHQEATHTLIHGTSFKVKAILCQDGTLRIKEIMEIP